MHDTTDPAQDSDCGTSAGDVDINAPEAWDIQTGTNPDVRVGILDSGIASHEDIGLQVLAGAAFAPDKFDQFGGCEAIGTLPLPTCDDPPSNLVDFANHGTPVSGIIVGKGDNEIGIASVAWGGSSVPGGGAKGVAFKVTMCNGLILSCWSAEAIEAARTWGPDSIRILNMSYAGTAEDPAERAAVRSAFYTGRLLVAAMGNNNLDTRLFPAGYGAPVCAVGAIADNGRRWAEELGSNFGDWIDLSAPGGAKIVTTALPPPAGQNYWAPCPFGFGGTSAATPIVSGVAALVLSARPELLGEDLQQVMSLTARDVVGLDPSGGQATPGWDPYTGYGLVRADAALRFVVEPRRPQLVQSGPMAVVATDQVERTFKAVDLLTDNQPYQVNRYRLQASLSWVPYEAVPNGWVRSSGTLGIRDTSFYDDTREVYWGRILSLQTGGATVETFVYEVLRPGQPSVWLPSGGLSQARVAMTAVGVILTGGGGCPFADTRTASGWQVENSLLGRSLTGALSLDVYRLKATPAELGGRYQVRLRENEQEYTTLDQVRLVAVDHARNVRAFKTESEFLLGTRIAAARVTSATGQDVTALVNGTSGGFRGGPGDTLLVAMTLGTSATFGAEAIQDHCLPGTVECDWKEEPALRYEGPQDYGARPAAATDQVILENTGILIQAPDGQGGWRTVKQHYPREFPDEAAFDSLGQGRLRLIFVGRHRVRFVGRVEPAATTPSLQLLGLMGAQHSRLGNVREAVGGAGGATTVLAPGDTLNLEFMALPVPPEQVREWFLLSTGVYSSAAPPAQLEPVGRPLPSRFALAQNQPNPFSPATIIAFEVPERCRVKLEVFDLSGRRLRTLMEGEYPAGYHTAGWDRRDAHGVKVRSGVYLYRLTAGAFRAQKRMVVVP